MRKLQLGGSYPTIITVEKLNGDKEKLYVAEDGIYKITEYGVEKYSLNQLPPMRIDLRDLTATIERPKQQPILYPIRSRRK